MKNGITPNPNIIFGDFTYFSDVDFKSHVTHHYDFNGISLLLENYVRLHHELIL